MDESVEVLELKFELLKQELIEYKIYIEVCAITIFFLLIVYMKKMFLPSANLVNSILNYVILFSAIILFAAIVIMTGRLIYLINTDVKTMKSYKKMKINNLLWSYR